MLEFFYISTFLLFFFSFEMKKTLILKNFWGFEVKKKLFPFIYLFSAVMEVDAWQNSN